jgi:hypothetical protein
MRRRRLGHFVAAAFAGTGIPVEISSAISNHSFLVKVGSSAIAVGLLLYVVIPRLRFASSAERPPSILWEMGFGRPRGAERWIPIALEGYLQPGERLEVAAIGSPGRGKFFRFVALTDRQLFLVKTLPPGLLPIRIDVSVPRAEARVVGYAAGQLGSSRMTLELGGASRRTMIFSRRFATQAKRLTEALSSSGPASTTPS